MQGFSVEYRNIGHWDVYRGGCHVYSIRGKKGKYIVRNKDIFNKKIEFTAKTTQTCMSFICDQLMYEKKQQ